MTVADLRQTERQAFHAAYDDGLWDVLLACWLLMFAVAPLLAAALGDFWSVAIFVPVWVVAYVLIRLIRSHFVAPRVGIVRVGEFRQRRLGRMTLILLAINIVAFVGGLIATVLGPSEGWATTIVFWLIVLAIFSVAAYFLDTPRLYLYGLMLGAAVVIGEWLFREGYAAHHGYPVMLGLATLVIAGVGLFRFVRVLGTTRRPASAAGEGPGER